MNKANHNPANDPPTARDRMPRILLFTGDGKGKTTAALGMALRAVGHEIPVSIIQFIKADATTGELKALARLPGVQIAQTGKGFVPPASHPAYAAHVEAARRGWRLAETTIRSGQYGLVVLDEICTAIQCGLLSESETVETLRHTNPRTTLVLTGRGAGPALTALADTVTEMRCVKHGADHGVKAQKGVEY
jgi:cob(I)alamin adenosyltransferase